MISGELISDTKLIKSCWVNHFTSIAESRSSSNPQVAAFSKRLPYLASLSELNSDDIVDDEFTVQEVEFALKRLKYRKAGGVDGLSREHLKYCGPLSLFG